MRPRVLVTRSSDQASDLAERLRAHALEPVLIPAIETAEPSSFRALDEAIAKLASAHFQWLIFTSANAVTVFAQRLRLAGITNAAELQAQLKVAVIGPGTARALRDTGLNVDLLPPQAVAESLTHALLPFARQPDGSPTRFLLVRAEEAREHLPESLRAAGAGVTIAPAYRTVIPRGSAEAIRELFAGPSFRPAAITFTSSSAVRNLLALCDAAGTKLPEESLRISIGPITSQTLVELGHPPHAEAREASVSALAEIVAKTLQLWKRP